LGYSSFASVLGGIPPEEEIMRKLEILKYSLITLLLLSATMANAFPWFVPPVGK
jgi:hypothetical protein